MTIVRAIDKSGDWNFGKGANDYRSGNDMVAQKLTTRLRSVLGDCFFALNDGIDWFNLLGSKDQLSLKLSTFVTVLNTKYVIGIIGFSATLDAARDFHLHYKVLTPFAGSVSGALTTEAGTLVTESGEVLTAEDGDPLGT